MREALSVVNEEMLFADGFDEALIGYVEQCTRPPVALYDFHKVIEILMEDMTYEEAMEYYDYNILGAYVGENTPAFAVMNV